MSTLLDTSIPEASNQIAITNGKGHLSQSERQVSTLQDASIPEESNQKMIVRDGSASNQAKKRRNRRNRKISGVQLRLHELMTEQLN